MARDEAYGFTLVDEVAKLRQRIHDDVLPRLRALELRDEQKAELVDRLSTQLERISDSVSAMAHQEEIAKAVADEVEKRAAVVAEALAERDKKWHERIGLPYRVLLGSAAAAGAVAVLASSLWQLIRYAGG